MIRAQCACVLPTVPLMRASFPSVIYLNAVIFIIIFIIFVDVNFVVVVVFKINLAVQCRLPGNYRANTSFLH